VFGILLKSLFFEGFKVLKRREESGERRENSGEGRGGGV
jgi:hypothetical protein